jgi:hypothetical protein
MTKEEKAQIKVGSKNRGRRAWKVGQLGFYHYRQTQEGTLKPCPHPSPS